MPDNLTHMGLLETVYDNEYKGKPPRPWRPRCVLCEWEGRDQYTLKKAQNDFQAHYQEKHS